MTPAATKILDALMQEVSQTSHVGLDGYTLMWRTGQKKTVFLPAIKELVAQKLVETLGDDLKSSVEIADDPSIEELAVIFFLPVV